MVLRGVACGFAYPLVHFKAGTMPAGSTWIRNPIPACAGPLGGGEMSECSAPQFPPPIPGLFGFGPARCVGTLPSNFSQILKLRNLVKILNCSLSEYWTWIDLFNFNIVDTLKVPDVAPGDYVLSWCSLL